MKNNRIFGAIIVLLSPVLTFPISDFFMLIIGKYIYSDEGIIMTQVFTFIAILAFGILLFIDNPFKSNDKIKES